MVALDAEKVRILCKVNLLSLLRARNDEYLCRPTVDWISVSAYK